MPRIAVEEPVERSEVVMKKSIAWPSILAMACSSHGSNLLPARPSRRRRRSGRRSPASRIRGLQPAGPIALLATVVGVPRDRAVREGERPGPMPPSTASPSANALGIADRPALAVTLAAATSSPHGRAPAGPWRAGPGAAAAGLADATVGPDHRPGRPVVNGPSPLATDLKLKPAPLEPTDLRFPINLATALRLSDARPLIVAAAQASVWVAEAQLTRAKVLWVPSVMFGVDYIRHDGGGPDFNKGIMTHPSVNFFYAGPSLWQYVNLTDAIFEPLVARQVLNARHWDVQSAKNDALLQTADAYFRVHQYRGMYAGALYTVERGHDLVDRIFSSARSWSPRSRSTGPGTCSPTWSSGPSWPARSGGSRAPT